MKTYEEERDEAALLHANWRDKDGINSFYAGYDACKERFEKIVADSVKQYGELRILMDAFKSACAQSDTMEEKTVIMANEIGFDNSCCYDFDDLISGIKNHHEAKLADRDRTIAEKDALIKKLDPNGFSELHSGFDMDSKLADRDRMIEKMKEVLKDYHGIAGHSGRGLSLSKFSSASQLLSEIAEWEKK